MIQQDCLRRLRPLARWLFLFAFFLSYALNVNADQEMGIVTARYYESSSDRTRLNYTDFGEPSPAFTLGTLWNGPANKKFKTMILRWRIADQFGNVPAYSKLEYEYYWSIEGARSNTNGSAGVVRALFESETDSPTSIYVHPDNTSGYELYTRNESSSWRTVHSGTRSRSIDNATSSSDKAITHCLYGTVSVANSNTYSNRLQINAANTHAYIGNWSITNYIYYDANEKCTSAPDTQTKLHTASIALSSTALKNVEYGHTGWNTSPNGTGTHYDFGDTYSDGRGVVLYAEWKPCMKAANLTLTPDKFKGKMTLRWTTSGDDANHYTAGKWFIFRKKVGETAYTKVAELVKASTSYTDTDLEVGVDYTYAISFVNDNYGSIDQPDVASITVTATGQLPKTFTFSNITKSNVKDANGGIHLSWTPEKSGASVALEKYITSSNTWNEIYSGTATEFTDRDVEPFAEYTYRLRTNMWSTDFYSEDISISFMVMSEVTRVTTSKGYYSNIVKINWDADQYGASDTRYVISRKILTDPKAVFSNIYETLGQASSYYYEDATALPGQYYVYRVTAFAKNNNTGKWAEGNSLESDGFSTSRGIISGRVSFGNGTAVEDVVVRLSKNTDDDDSTPQFYSLTSQDETGLMTWTPDETTLNNYLGGNPLSIQMWVSADRDVPASGERAFFNIKDQVTLYLKDASEEGRYEIVAKVPGADKKSTGLTVKADVYSNITFVSDGKGNYTIFASDGIDGEGQTIFNSASITGSDISWTNGNDINSITLGANGNANDIFVGNIDDVRIWRTALAENDIRKNHNRILAGTEANLLCYWPLDEGVNGIPYVYDVSKTNGVANGNHAVLSKNAMFSGSTPTEDQLSLFGLTDSQGNFTVRGVPFIGDGTSYTITPIKGVHEFNPSYVNRYVSNNSLTHDGVDFKDVSSFPVKGCVYYENTTIPVEGAQLYVDGTLASKDGAAIETNAEGEFAIDVPIGDHYISVKKNGHTFHNDGRYPEDPQNIGTRQTFTGAVSGLTFYDNTMVMVAGRVAGGIDEQNKPLGVGQGKANIGQAKVVLSFEGHDRYKINVEKVTEGLTTRYEDAKTDRVFDCNSDYIYSSSAKVDVTNKPNYITVFTDPRSGEFAAMLPPLLYHVESIEIPSQPSVSFGSKPTIDASNPLSVTTDSVEVELDNGVEMRRFEYVAQAKMIYRSESHLDVTQDGETAFGEASIDVTDVVGNTTIVPVYATNSNGSVNYGPNNEVDYTFGYPVYRMKGQYALDFFAYETYENYDESANNGGKPEVTILPLQGANVSIANEFASTTAVVVKGDAEHPRGSIHEMEDNNLELDSLGRGRYIFTAGMPNIQAPYTRGISISYNVDGDNKSWGKIEAVVLGQLTKGNDFITEAPDKVLMVLRDPPGTSSSATWSKGTTITASHGRTFSRHSNTEVNLTHMFGTRVKNSTGTFAFAVINEFDSKVNVETGYSINYSEDEDYTRTTSLTTTRDISTSDSPDFVGYLGDIYFGTSRNYVIGATTEVSIVKNEATGKYEVNSGDALAVGDQYTTTFAYTHNFIENILIPSFEEKRNMQLIHVTEDQLASFPQPQGESPIYLTTLSEDDELFGSRNDDEAWGTQAVTWDWTNIPEGTTRLIGPSYTVVFPTKDVSFSDTIQYFNNQIEGWQQQIGNNEETKVRCIKEKREHDNYSFDAGSIITKTVESSVEGTRTISHTWDHNFHVGSEIGFTFNGFGLKVEATEDAGMTYVHNDVKDTVTVASFSYTLAEDGDDDYLTVDVYENPGDGFSPVFYTKAGATSAPHEDQVVTSYYEPGFVISQRTLQIEKPELYIPDSLITGVPAGKEALLPIELRNNSETGEDVYYGLWINPNTNPDGLEVFMDGQPITTGIEILVPSSEPIKKTLRIRQSNQDVLEYENVQLSFYSLSQSDDTGIFPGIYCDRGFTIKFQPSCTDIELAASSVVSNTENGQITLMMKGFDFNQDNFERIRVEYKGINDPDFHILKEYVKNVEKYTSRYPELETFDALSISKPTLNYTVDLSSNLYTDQTYIFRASSIGMRNGQEVTSKSEEIMVARDMSRPQIITTPTPSNGILGPGDDITLTFNEDIRNNLLTKLGNFHITGVMNDTEVAHDVALSLTGSGTAKTQATINLDRKDFAADMWLKYTTDGVIMQHGATGNKITVSAENGKLAVAVGDKKVVSTADLPKDKWLFLALNYDYANGEHPVVNASYALDADIVTLLYQQAMPEYTGAGPVSLGGNGMTAQIQELSLWNEARSIADALVDRNRTKSPNTSGLIGYWQFNEGYGSKATDRSRNRHMTLASENSWFVNAGTNYVASLDGNTAILASTGVYTKSDESYLIETWFRADTENNGKATILSIPNAVDIALGESGNVEVTSEKVTTNAYNANLKDGQWHHMALNVTKSTGGGATLYIDGVARRQFSSKSVPNLTEGVITLGGRYWGEGEELKYEQFLKGDIDEVRVWKGRYTSDIILNNMRTRVENDAEGLAAYYPMESRALDSYGQVVTSPITSETAGSGTDLIVRQGAVGDIHGEMTFAEDGPSLKQTPARENVQFSYVASERQITITLQEEPYKIENCNIFLTVKDVKDVNGNASDDISWVIYAQQNPLKWSESDIDLMITEQETKKFTVEISNESAEADNWTLSGVPSWLNVDVENGVLAPQQTKRLTFEVVPGTAIGMYDATVYLSGKLNINAPLNISLRVKGEAPNWNPIPDEDAMMVVAQLNIDGVISSDTEDMVAAFRGLDCVGMAHPSYDSKSDTYILTLSVYGHEENTPLIYKAYDASTGTVYPFITSSKPEAYTFNASKWVGTFDDMTVFTPENKIEQPLASERSGWKWFSMYVTTDEDNTVASVFTNSSEKLLQIKGKDANTEFTSGQWYGSLDKFSLGQTYKLQAGEAFQEVAIGAPADPAAVSISLGANGWSWIGYPLQYATPIADAFADADPQDGDIVMSQSLFAMYNGSEWRGSLMAMNPGEGYKYYSVSNTKKTFHYQKPAMSWAKAYRSKAASAAEDILTLTYADNMAIVAQVVDGGSLVADASVMVYGNVELLGYSAKSDYEGLHYITVGGDTDGLGLSFVVTVGDDQYVFYGKTKFVADGVIGNLRNPWCIELSEATMVNGIVCDDRVKDVETYDLSGVRVSNNISKPGVYVQKLTFDDGSTISVKSVKK